MPQVVLIRHGETAWSREGRHTGREDIPLDADGEAQARTLGPRLRGWQFADVFVSPLLRARQTCALAGYADVAEVDENLPEWDYGEYGGRTAADIQLERPGWLIWDDGVPGGETIAAVAERADAVIERVRMIDGDTALFAHGHLLRVLAVRWLGLAPVEGEHLAFSPAAISVLGDDRGSPIVWRWNDAGHD